MVRLLILLLSFIFVFSCNSDNNGNEEHDSDFCNDEISDFSESEIKIDEDYLEEPDETDISDEENIVIYPGIYLSRRSLKVSEQGKQDFFEINLSTRPDSEVRFEIKNIDNSEMIVEPEVLVFTPDNWSALQIVSVTGKNDDEKDGNVTVGIYLEAISEDNDYDGFNSGNINVTVTDDDSASVIISETYLLTSEDEEETYISVKLGVEPKNDVTLTFSSSLISEGKFENDTLTFTKESWNGIQKIALKGVDDNESDGDREYSVNIGVSSEDTAYAELEIAPLTVVNIDNDSAGIITKISKNEVNEKGKTTSFSLKLKSKPSSDVTVKIKSDDESEGVTDLNEVIFTTSNWNKNVKITLTGKDDNIKDGDQLFHITFTAESQDISYNGVAATPLDIINRDDDKAGFFFENENLITTEDSGTDTIKIKLATMPSDDVEMLFLVTDSTEGNVAYEIFTIHKSEWDSFYSIELKGVDDEIKDGDIEYQVQMLVASSDPDYDNYIIKAIDAVNMDDE